MEIVPFNLSSLDSFDQSDQRVTPPSSCDGYYPASQCDLQQQDTFLQGDTTAHTIQLQPVHHGVKATTARHLSIFRPRFQSDYHYYEQARGSNQATNDCSFEGSAGAHRCPTTLQHKRHIQVSVGRLIANTNISFSMNYTMLYLYVSLFVPSHLVKPVK